MYIVIVTVFMLTWSHGFDSYKVVMTVQSGLKSWKFQIVFKLFLPQENNNQPTKVGFVSSNLVTACGPICSFIPQCALLIQLLMTDAFLLFHSTTHTAFLQSKVGHLVFVLAGYIEDAN